MTTTPLQPKFDALRDILNIELVERKDEIDGALLALVGSSTFFLLGGPGTAKSLLPARLCAYITDTRLFDILLTKFTLDTEVFGPSSMIGLQEDRFERVTDGYLPTARVSMLDECFKASSSILNSLLWAINERKYRHGKSVVTIPLSTLFCASNELPQDDSLAALYDRLVLKYEVRSVQDPGNFRSMLRTNRPENPEPILSWDEVAQAQEEAKKVVIPDDVLDALVELRRILKDDHGIEPSERRFVQSLKIVRAAAWLDGCDEADIDHLRPLEHIMWLTPEQRPDVSKTVLGLANPLEVEAMKLLDAINKLESQIDDIKTEDDRVKVGNEINGKIRKAKRDLDDLMTRAGTSTRRNRRIEEVQDRLRVTTDRILVDVFRFSPEEAAQVRKESQ